MQLKQIEPCVRITLQIPKDAAQRLRQMAAEGNAALQALGILSVQIEGDSVISLKLAGQDIGLRTTDNGKGLENETSGTSSINLNSNCSGTISDISQLLKAASNSTINLGGGGTKNSVLLSQHPQQRGPVSTNAVQGNVELLSLQQQIIQQRRNMLLGGPSTSSAAQAALMQKQHHISMNTSNSPQVFKSPNTICPMDGKVPVPPLPLNAGAGPNSREFPFESMRQARVLQGRDSTLNTGVNAAGLSITTGSVPMLHGQQQQIGGIGAPPNVSIKAIKNNQNGELSTTIAASNKSHFLHPPPPPYPGVGGNSPTVSLSSPSHSSKSIPNYLQQNAITPNATSATSTNNIAISSPLLVNLLQNDGNSVANQMKSLSSPQHQLIQNQPQTSLSNISPNSLNAQQHIVSTQIRTSTTPTEFMLSQQQVVSTGSESVRSSTPAIGLPSPTPNSNLRNLQQQIQLSPSNNALYSQQQQQRFQQQQQISPQQANVIRQQQMHRQQILQSNVGAVTSQQQRAMPQQQFQQQLLQAPGGAAILSSQHQQAQLRQIRPGVPVPQPSQPFMPTGGVSPVAHSHSPASSHHSMHSPLMTSHQQTILSPSGTPTQSPHSHVVTQQVQIQQQQQMQIQQQQPILVGSPSHGANVQPSIVSTSPLIQSSSSTPSLPPPPDYNQAAGMSASGRWPVLNKPMDSITKSSFQEFTRYQMQYNLQQQQITNSQQEHHLQHHQHQHPNQQHHQQQLQDLQQQNQNSGMSNDLQVPDPTMGSATNSTTAMDNAVEGNLPDSIITLSDLDALATNDLDALLPTLNCDLDSALSLEDNNELESLLQDAKDLDLDLIEENLKAVDGDIDQTELLAAEDTQISSNTSMSMNTVQIASQVQQHGMTSHQNSNHIISDGMPRHQNSYQPHHHQQQQQQQHNQQPILLQRQQQQHHLMQQQQRQQLQIHLLQQRQNQVQKNATNFVRSASITSAARNSTQKQLLINPLTGELEPTPSDDSDTEVEQETKHLLSTKPSFGNMNPSEVLPNALFSEEDSNSCSTAVSKASAVLDHNNGALLGGGSDTERSRDSLASNKSNRSRKISKATQPLCNRVGAVANSGELGSASPRSTNSSPLAASGNIPNSTPSSGSTKKTKSNLLREKLQQGVKEKKKDNLTKPKRERAKSGGKAKGVATIASTTNLISEAGVSQSNSTPSSSISDSMQSNEKIKLRLKLEKSEPVSPAYKVDVSFVQSPKNSDVGGSKNSGVACLDQKVNNVTQQNQMESFISNANANAMHQQHVQILQPQMQRLSATQHSQNIGSFSSPQMANISLSTTTTTNTITSQSEEPRVPPLHISLRGGKNSIVIKNSRKDRKKSSADAEDDSKSNKHLKRNLTISTISQDSQGVSKDSVSDAKHPKMLPQYNGRDSCEVNHKLSTTATVANSTMSTAAQVNSLAGKNGLTINALPSIIENKSNSMENVTIGSTNVGTIQLPGQGGQQQHLNLSKIVTTLPSSLTLSTITSGNPGGVSNRVLGNLFIKNPLRATATLTPITGGKPLAKNQKPPSYLTAVQQLQLQKQQKQQLHHHPHQAQHHHQQILEKPTAQQLVLAANTILPSTTTLTRIGVAKSSLVEHMETVVQKHEQLDASKIANVDENCDKRTSLDIVDNLKATAVKCSIEAGMSSKVGNLPQIPSSTTITPVQAVGNLTAVSSVVSILPGVRNSPANNGNGTPGHGTSGTGEDSGIESMDALSEKSPHQNSSSSPAQLPEKLLTTNANSNVPASDHPIKVVENESINMDVKIDATNRESDKKDVNSQQRVKINNSADDEIEKALAKMDSFNDDQVQEVHMVLNDNLNTNVEPKINGEHITLLEELDNTDDLIKNLTETMGAGEKLQAIHELDDIEMSTVDLSEGQLDRSKGNSDDKEKCSATLGSKTTLNMEEQVEADSKVNVDDKINDSSTAAIIVDKECDNDNHKEEQQSAPLPPISIDIPINSDAETPRVRTRASIRLESPLDKVKPSPSISLGNVVSQASTDIVKNVIVNENVSADSLTTSESVQNNNKRKRLESEASNSNDASDAKRICVETKATSVSNSILTSSVSNISNPDEVNVPLNTAPKVVSLSTTSVAITANESGLTSAISSLESDKGNIKKVEESSDSDEPLIEVAGKVRNSKVITVADSNENNVITIPGSETIGTAEKVTRNSRTNHPINKSSNLFDNNNRSVSVGATPPNETPTSILTVSSPSPATSTSISTPITSANTTTGKGGKSTTVTPSIANVNATSENAILTNSNSINAVAVTTPVSLTVVHATRGAVHATAATATVTSAATPTTVTANHNNTSTNSGASGTILTEEKIGTRRSVRASAAANKNCSRAITNNASISSPVLDTKSTSVKGSGHSGETIAEVRRKTRSAVIGESLMAEGRRRRGSRENK